MALAALLGRRYSGVELRWGSGMAKIVYASLKRPRASRAHPRTKGMVQSKTVTAPDGSRLKISTVDAESPTFSQDLTAVFRRNVARARRENRRIIDEADRLASEA